MLRAEALWKNADMRRLCENPNCRDPLPAHAPPHQKVCGKERCIRWKSRENRRAFRIRRGLERIPVPDTIIMPTWGEGCAVGSTLWCPFPGIENW